MNKRVCQLHCKSTAASVCKPPCTGRLNDKYNCALLLQGPYLLANACSHWNSWNLRTVTTYLSHAQTCTCASTMSRHLFYMCINGDSLSGAFLCDRRRLTQRVSILPAQHTCGMDGGEVTDAMIDGLE